MFQGIVTQLSEQISTLNERMDEFTSRIEELNSTVSIRKVSASQQNLALQGDGCSAIAPSSLFASGVGNGLLSGSLLPSSSSSSQLARESAFMEEVTFRSLIGTLSSSFERGNNIKELTQTRLGLVDFLRNKRIKDLGTVSLHNYKKDALILLVKLNIISITYSEVMLKKLLE